MNFKKFRNGFLALLGAGAIFLTSNNGDSPPSDSALSGGPPTGDTTIYLNCKDEIKMFQFFPGPQQYPEIDTDIVEINNLPCVPLNLIGGINFNGLCAEGYLENKLGNSCNILVNPKPTCVMQFRNPTKDSTLNVSGKTKHATVIERFWFNYAWVTQSTMARPQNKPNSPRWLFAELYDGNWNLKAIDSVNIDVVFTKDSSGLVEFYFHQYFDANKDYHILVYGKDFLYGYKYCDPFTDPNCNLPIMEFYGSEIEFLCAGLGNLCLWGPAKKVWEENNGCEKIMYYEWISSCGDKFVAKYVLTDRDAPLVLNKPKDVTISLYKDECELEYYVPSISFDDCDKNAKVEITAPTLFQGVIRGNGGYVPGYVYQGKWPITYTITDACGNSTSCSYTLCVKELNDFTLVCKGSTVVALNDSCSFVAASKFVVGTTGLCCYSYTVYGMRMDNQKGGKDLKFCCSDVGKKVMVMLTAISNCDTTVRNSCMVEVEVQNKQIPQITCPTDRTVSCDTFDISNLSKYGKPVATANCGVFVKDTFTVSLDDCKSGTVVRTFTATGSNGMTAQCSQTITVINANPLKGTDIVWPSPDTLYDCHATYDPDKTGRPSVSKNYRGCSKALYSYSDQVFFAGGNGICKKILRTWKAIDCCYPYNKPWEQVQIITLRDSVKPVITYCPKDTAVGNLGACSDSVLVNLESVTATDCGGILKITNDSKYSFVKGANASGKYPNGTHKVTFTVSDSCGTTSSCVINITVSDKKPPSFRCNDVITELQDMPGMGITQRVDVDKLCFKKEDNCCPSDRITVSFAKDTLITTLWFTCKDIGENIVELWFWDCNGNKDLCKPKIIIQDNNHLCPPTFKDTLMVAGLLKRPNGKEVEHVEVKLDSHQMVCTGFYKFDSLAPQTHLVKPYKDEDPLEGVSTRDIVLIQRFILGKITFTPYQMIAADVNHSGSITSADISELRRLILGIIPTFQNNISWRFVPQSYVFPNGNMNWNFPEFLSIGYGSPPGDVLDADFYGIKVGDVDGSSNFSSLVTREREEGEDFLVLKVSPNPAGEYIVVDCPYFDLFEDGTISIIDMMGRGVYFSKFYSSMKISVKDLNSGVYILKVNSDKLEDSETKVFLKL